MSEKKTMIPLLLLLAWASGPLGCDGGGGDLLCDKGCGFPWECGGSSPFIAEVVEFSPAEGATFGAEALPEVVLGPPQGAGESVGSLDVLSLGCGGSITVRFDGPGITDGPGADLIVFENAFVRGSMVFAEPAQVSVSADGEAFVPFPCDPETLEGCAGQVPVLAAPEGCVDPTAPEAGGDAFDLADVGLTEASYLRIEDRSAENAFASVWCGDDASGFDLDAAAFVVH